MARADIIPQLHQNRGFIEQRGWDYIPNHDPANPRDMCEDAELADIVNPRIEDHFNPASFVEHNGPLWRWLDEPANQIEGAVYDVFGMWRGLDVKVRVSFTDGSWHNHGVKP